VTARGKVERNAAGTPVRFPGVVIDITERKTSEERERRLTAEAMAANAKFRTIFDQSSVFAGILTVDGILIDANKLCLEACGYQAERELGRPFWKTSWWRKSKEVQKKIRSAGQKAAKGEIYRETL